jgi:hypothetical protein
MGLKDEKIVRGSCNVEKMGVLTGQKGPKGWRPARGDAALPEFGNP